MKHVLRFLLVAGAQLLLFGQGDFEKGISYYKQGRYHKAIEQFEQMVQVNRGYESGYRVLGECYLKTEQYEKATEAFQKALELEDDQYASYLGLALAYYNRESHEKVVETLLKGERYSRSPHDRYQLFHIRGSSNFDLNHFDEAVRDLSKAVSIKRGKPKHILQLGIAYYRLGKHSEAERFLSQALALAPASLEAKRYLAHARYQQSVDAIEGKNYSGAAIILKDYVKQNPQDGEAWFNLGLAYLFTQDLRASERAFLESTKLLPQHSRTYERLGYLYEKTNRYDKALNHYQRAYNLSRTPQAKESIERVRERIRRGKS